MDTADSIDVKERAFEREVERRARRFDLKALLDLLRAHGYQHHELLYESSHGGSSSSSIIEGVRFEHTPRRLVYITLNLGLLGDSSLLPSYFFETIEKTSDPDVFFDFIRYFDHRLLAGLVRSLYPEDDDLMFRDWGKAKEQFVKMLGMGSTCTLQWLLQLYFPELRVQVHRKSFSTTTVSHAFRPGDSQLDGTGVLGRIYTSAESGFVADLVAEEEENARGKSWAKVVKNRLNDRVLPLLEPYRLPLVVRLRVMVHASWLKVESKDNHTGFLGYDRFVTDEESGHTIIVHPSKSPSGED